jgi:hypothetical protein
MSVSRMGKFLSSVSSRVVIVIALAGGVFAQALECVPGSLAFYQAPGSQGCVVGDARFSNFKYRQADGLAAPSINLTPGTAPDSNDPGLLVEGAWTTPSQGSSISYTVEILRGKLIDGGTLEMQFGQISGTGEARVVTQICAPVEGSDSCVTGSLKLQVLLTAGTEKRVRQTSRIATPLRQVEVVSAISLANGNNGTANISGFLTALHRKAD